MAATIVQSAGDGGLLTPGALFGLLLVAGIAGSTAAYLLRIPRIIGYLGGGVALRAILGATLAEPDAPADFAREMRILKPVADVALGLILFTIGGVFERSRLRAGGVKALEISACDAGITMLLVFIGVTLAAGAAGAAGWGAAAVLGLLLATTAVETAPASTLHVLREFQAKGAITDALLRVTAFSNIACLVLFHAAFLLLAWAGALQTSGAVGRHLWLGVLATLLGSAALGLVLGAALSVAHARLNVPETLLVCCAVFILVAAGQRWLLSHVGVSYNAFLALLVSGAVFFNVAVDPPRLEEALHTMGTPLLAAFFVMAGFDLHVRDLVAMGWLGGAYVLCRLAGKLVGLAAGTRLTGQTTPAGYGLGTGALCQASLGIGLAAFAGEFWGGELSRRFTTVLLGSIVLFELIGPLLLKRSVVRGGEVKAITLMRRAGAGGGAGAGLRRTLHALGRLLRPAPKARGADARKLTIGHIMRANVQLIPAAASFEDVLHFMERSTYDHFPVVNPDGTFAGIIHFSDVREIIYDPALHDLVTAVDLADSDAPIVTIDAGLEEVLAIFHEHNIGALPISDGTDQRRIIGIVEQRDLLRALHRLQKPG